jgi:hypothetical protein
VNPVHERYEPAVADARRALERHPRLLGMLAPDQPADLLQLLLIRYNAHGVRMTEQVESWIDRAGQRCAELGWAELGAALRAHARSESGHEKLMEDDTRVLVSKWNAEHTRQLDAQALLASSPLYSTRKYVQLHEETIASERPYCQVAIEYEIERLSLVVGPAILSRTTEAAGGQGISFLAEHVELDQDHTAFDERQLRQLIDQDGNTLVPLVETGRLALQYYLGFVLECIELAEADYKRSQQA